MVGTEDQSRAVGTASRVNRVRLQYKQAPREVAIDRWVSKIFTIINSGPSGGFVRYAIGSRNNLYVDCTGNRSEIELVVNELLPKDACRYIAYSFRYRKNDIGPMRTRVIWIVWTPEAAPEPERKQYLNGLAGVLISLQCPGDIPIVNARSPTDLDTATIMTQL